MRTRIREKSREGAAFSLSHQGKEAARPSALLPSLLAARVKQKQTRSPGKTLFSQLELYRVLAEWAFSKGQRRGWREGVSSRFVSTQELLAGWLAC